MNIGEFQNNIADLPSIDLERYENIFKTFTVDKTNTDRYYFYNILGKISIPKQLNEELLDTIKLNTRLPWTTLSYKIYNTQYLWWLIFLLNKPENIFFAEAGIEYKYVLPGYLDLVLENIQSQIS
jgi:hypothetical protein